MGPLDDLPGPLPEAEHPLQGSQLAVDGGVRRPLRLAKPIGRGGTTRRPSRPRPLPEPDSTTHRETWEVLRGAALHGLSHANDGTKAYTWNARNQLTAVGTTPFGYDGLGRRQKQGSGNAVREFLYDGLNPVQEKKGNQVKAIDSLGQGFPRPPTQPAGRRLIRTRPGWRTTNRPRSPSPRCSTSFTTAPGRSRRALAGNRSRKTPRVAAWSAWTS